MDDRQIIEKVKSGDTQAFEALVLRYQQKVYNIAFRMTGNESDAFDLSQEAFLRVWRSLGDFQFESAFSTWLYRLTSNVCIDFLRSQKHKQTVSLTVADEDDALLQIDIPDPAPGPEQAAIAAEDRALLAQALEQIDPEARLILTLRVINDLSYEEISKVLSMKEGTVKSRISRARAKLKKKLLQIRNQPSVSSSKQSGKEDAPWSATMR